MTLPIDARKAPFPEKYIDEETPKLCLWMIFGQNKTDGTYHVSQMSNGDDVVIGLTFQQAEELVRARNVFVDEFLRIVNRRDPS